MNQFPRLQKTASSHRFLESRDGRHVQAGDDGHQGVEVAGVEALAAHLYPVLDQPHALLLLHVLKEIEVGKVRWYSSPFSRANSTSFGQ